MCVKSFIKDGGRWYGNLCHETGTMTGFVGILHPSISPCVYAPWRQLYSSPRMTYPFGFIAIYTSSSLHKYIRNGTTSAINGTGNVTWEFGLLTLLIKPRWWQNGIAVQERGTLISSSPYYVNYLTACDSKVHFSCTNFGLHRDGSCVCRGSQWKDYIIIAITEASYYEQRKRGGAHCRRKELSVPLY